MTTMIQPTARPQSFPLLPERPARLGPISRRLLLRLAVVVSLVEAVGAALILSGSTAAVAAGTSLVFPGAGFVYVAWPVLFALTLVLLLIATVLWWGASVHAAIPAVWLLSVAGSAALADGPRLLTGSGSTWPWAVPFAGACAAVFVGVGVYRFERRYRSKVAEVPALNEYLLSADPIVRQPLVRTPDQTDLALLRWAYDLAHQPADGLAGLDWGDQFHSGTQLRYQLNALCWALSLYAANFVPNAAGQMEGTIAKLIEKHTDLRVWKYWRTLNVLGNLDTNPDPIVRDNIMFSAFLGDVLNIFEAATGSDRFDQPGSLTFVWTDGRTFEYDHHTIAAAVERNFESSPLGFFPCEPGWSFTVCNTMGAQALFGHDRLHGTMAWQKVKPRWVQTLEEEYSSPDGSYAHIRSNHVGLSWDTGEVPGGHYLAAGSNKFADILPEHAKRAALLERRRAEGKIRALAAKVTDGGLDMTLPPQLERHRGRSSALTGWNGVIGGARLLGESALMQAALDAAARQCASGGRWPERPMDASVPAIGGHMMLRWSNPLSTADLNKRGFVAPTGPCLDTAGWTAALVTEARSVDGERLLVRVLPTTSVSTTVPLRFTQLEPLASYRLTVGRNSALDLFADADGMGSTSIELTDAVVVELTPMEDAEVPA